MSRTSIGPGTVGFSPALPARSSVAACLLLGGLAVRAPSFAAAQQPEFASAQQTMPLGDIAGELAWEVPQGAGGSYGFVLRGTLPVPPNTTTGARIPLRILNHDGTGVTATQVETVTRYADGSQGADVVEVIAPVSKDPAWIPGSVHNYKVQYFQGGLWPSVPASPTIEDLIGGIGAANLPDSIESLIHDPLGIEIRCRDAKGNAFVAYPLKDAVRRLHRYGPSMVTLETYSTLVPLIPLPPGESYPHMMGVHAYITTLRGEEALLLDLRFNNGASGLDPVSELDDILGKIYFNSMDLDVRQDAHLWYAQQQFIDPFAFNPSAHPPDTPGAVGSLYWSYPS